MSDSEQRPVRDDAASPVPMSRGVRSVPAILLVLWLATIVWFHVIQTDDPGITNIATMAATVTAVIWLVIWWTRSSGTTGIKRFAPLILLTTGIAVFSALFELRFTGAMGINPKFRWTKPKLPELPPESASAGKRATAGDAVIDPSRDFPQFLGPNRDGRIRGVRLATDWKTKPPKQLWKQPIGRGWAGFAIVGDYAITLEQRPQGEMTVCYDLKTGKIRWAKPTLESKAASFSQFPGGIGPRSTPAIDDANTYTLGATGILNCFDLVSGKRIWTRDILKENDAENVTWGKSCSPLVVDAKVIVSAGGTDSKSLVAYHTMTGELVWQGGERLSSYASPTLATIADVRQILMVNEDYITSHDVDDGRVLWEIDWPGKSGSNANVSQAVPISGDRVFISKGYGGGAALFKVTHDSDGNWPAPEELWRNQRVMKTKFSNVVVRDGYVYGMDEKILQCINLETGKQQWKETAGRFDYGQILLVDDLIMVMTETQGDLVLVQATPEAFRLLARFAAIEGQSWNPIALAGKYLILRNAEWAACYELPLRDD